MTMPKVTPQSTPAFPALPPLTLVTGGAGSGKTRFLQNRFAEFTSGCALLITASPAEAVSLQTQISRLTERPPEELKPWIGTFRHLVSNWSLQTVQEGEQAVTKSFQRLALLDIFRRETRPEHYFGRLLESPGFVPALVERVREWKLAEVTPEIFLEAARKVELRDEEARRRLISLAKLYACYEDLLTTHRLYDEEDALRRVREEMERGHTLPAPYESVEAIFVDGFYRFNRAQQSLLRVLAERGVEVTVALPYAPDRSDLFASPARTLTEFQKEFHLTVLTQKADKEDRPPALAALEKWLFLAPDPGVSPVEASPQTLLLHDAPNPFIEVEMAAREFRRRYSQGGFRWSDFGVVLRTQGDYAPILTSVFERYEIPIGIDGPEELLENPFLKTLLALLEVYRHGWKHEEIARFLKSSYLGHSRLEVDRALRLAKAKRVGAEREEWRAFALGLSSELRETIFRMAALEVEIELRSEPLSFYREWLLRVVAEFEFETKIEEGFSLRAQRDRTAWETAQEVLEAIQHLSRLGGKKTFTFEPFCERLREAWSRTSTLASAEGDRVQVLEPYETRSTPLRVAAVMGLTERVFPRRILEDPFVRDSERIALRLHGLRLEPQLERADDERLFFYFAVTAPSDALILSYPRSSADSDTLPSFYLDEIRGIVRELPVVSRTLNDVAPRQEDVVGETDALLAFCAEAFDPRTPGRGVSLTLEAASLLKTCQASPQLFETLQIVAASRHLPPLPRLEAEDLLQKFTAHKSVFSITELEDYRRCPFSYLLKHVFRLKPEESAAEAQIRSLLFRKTMHRFFRSRKKTEETGTALGVTEMERALLALGEAVLEEETPDLSPLQLRFLKRGLREALQSAAGREVQFAERFGMKTAHIGLTFGRPVSGESDPSSVSEPVYIEPAGEEESGVWVSGAIDRVDLDPNGKQALLMHYRTSAPPDLDFAERGESLTLPLSLLAMHQLFRGEPIAACFDAPGSGRTRLYRHGAGIEGAERFRPLPGESGKNVRLRNPGQYAQMLENARTVTLEAARELRSGKVHTKPGDHCEPCAYRDVCRTTPAGEHDGEPPLPL